MEKKWHTKRHKLSCRGLEYSPDGDKLVSVGKDGVIKIADSETGKVTAKDTGAHTFCRPQRISLIGREAIDAVKYVNENIFVTGDDVGIVRVLHPTVFLTIEGMGYPNIKTRSNIS